MEILIVVAHPDDEVLGLGGTIAKMVDNGMRAHLAILTDGSSTQYSRDEYKDIINQKKEETKKCAELLGICSIDYGPFLDMKLDTFPHVAINDYIDLLVDTYKPSLVFTHFWGDLNRDHQLVFNSTMVAARPVLGQSIKKIVCFKTPSSTEWNAPNITTTFSPNMFVDISKYEKLKQEAINCYQHELRAFPHPRSIEAIESLDKAAGTRIGCEYAEEFVIVREMV